MLRFEKMVVAAVLGLALVACGSGDSPDVAARAGAAAEDLKESAKSMADKTKSLSDEAAKGASAAADSMREKADAMGEKASELEASLKGDAANCLSLVGQAEFQQALPVCTAALSGDPTNTKLQQAVEQAKAGAASAAAAGEAAGDAAGAAKKLLGGQ